MVLAIMILMIISMGAGCNSDGFDNDDFEDCQYGGRQDAIVMVSTMMILKILNGGQAGCNSDGFDNDDFEDFEWGAGWMRQ